MIEAGVTFRLLAEAHGGVEITEIRRQRDDRQQGTTRALGTVEHVTPGYMAIRTDDGRSVAFNLKDYAHVDHGYPGHFSMKILGQLSEVITRTLPVGRPRFGLENFKPTLCVFVWRNDFNLREQVSGTVRLRYS